MASNLVIRAVHLPVAEGRHPQQFSARDGHVVVPGSAVQYTFDHVLIGADPALVYQRLAQRLVRAAFSDDNTSSSIFVCGPRDSYLQFLLYGDWQRKGLIQLMYACSLHLAHLYL